jgi:hypothetical protein
VTVFYTRFNDYIYGENLGYKTDDEGTQEGDPGFEADHAYDTYQNKAIGANFFGIEASYERVLYRKGEDALSLSLMADWIQAEERRAFHRYASASVSTTKALIGAQA